MALLTRVERPEAAVHTPHQIRVVETAHSVINATMRAIMCFANAPREMWALARRYAALLNNYMATRYNQNGTAIVPMLALANSFKMALPARPLQILQVPQIPQIP